MLQIIGWLLCVYLVVKGFELIAMKNTYAYIGAGIAFVAAPIFFLMINEQVKASAQPMSQLGLSDPYVDDATANMTDAELDAAADRALENAQTALDGAGE